MPTARRLAKNVGIIDAMMELFIGSWGAELDTGWLMKGAADADNQSRDDVGGW